MKNFIFILLVGFWGCNSTTTTKTSSTKVNSQKNTERINVQVISNKQKPFTIGDEVLLSYKTENMPAPDSVKLSINFKAYKNYTNEDAIRWNTKNETPGIKQVQLTLYWGDSLSANGSIKHELLSDLLPKLYTYKTKNKWPHNIKAYTQGLEFSEGLLYEGTGNYGESTLNKIDLDKSEIIQSINLPKEVFGEGITIINDKIYQITWRTNVGFVYDKTNLKQLFEFTYPTEGWGLTNDGKELIMSDGSQNIYFLDTEFIQETRKIQVYDNIGTVTNLNELEYIDGLIYANIYGSDEIIVFEPETGKVTKRIDLTGILDKKNIKTRIDVLNGIAWDKENQRLIVTGKWWPYFFEIELIEK